MCVKLMTIIIADLRAATRKKGNYELTHFTIKFYLLCLYYGGHYWYTALHAQDIVMTVQRFYNVFLCPSDPIS